MVWDLYAFSVRGVPLAVSIISNLRRIMTDLNGPSAAVSSLSYSLFELWKLFWWILQNDPQYHSFLCVHLTFFFFFSFFLFVFCLVTSLSSSTCCMGLFLFLLYLWLRIIIVCADFLCGFFKSLLKFIVMWVYVPCK